MVKKTLICTAAVVLGLAFLGSTQAEARHRRGCGYRNSVRSNFRYRTFSRRTTSFNRGYRNPGWYNTGYWGGGGHWGGHHHHGGHWGGHHGGHWGGHHGGHH